MPVNEAESQHDITTEEEDLQVYILAYKALKDSFRSRSRFVLLHIEDDIWEVRIIGLTSREWLEYCANVFAELPSETVKLAEEAVPVFSEAAALMENIPFEQEEEPDSEEDAEEEEVEEEEEPEEESPKPKRTIVVRRTGDKNVTVETDQ